MTFYPPSTFHEPQHVLFIIHLSLLTKYRPGLPQAFSEQNAFAMTMLYSAY